MANSICVTGNGVIRFTIYQTPLVEDHQDPGLQREYTPAVPGGDGTELPASVALRLFEATEATKWTPATKNDLGTDYLAAVKNGHGIAIRAHGATEGRQFRVKILAGGVNVASPPPFKSSSLGLSYPDYFLMPDQQWVFGVRVGESSVRQFRVVEGGTRFSLKSLYKRKEDESIGIQITSFRLKDAARASVRSIRPALPVPSARDENISEGEAELPLKETKTAASFNIFVKSCRGKTFLLQEVKESDTVESLRKRIQEKDGTPLDNLRIVFLGRQMEDGRIVGDYNLQRDDTLYVVVRLKGGSRGITSTLSDLPGSENAETSLKPEQLGPGGRVHQDFVVDPDPEDWMTVGTHTMRFYFFDADHFKRKTGLDLNPIDYPGRLHRIDSFLEDRFPAFRGRAAAVSIPSIAQLYRQFKRDEQRGARVQDHTQNEQDPGQQGDTDEEFYHGDWSIGPTQKQSCGKKFLSALLCCRE